MKKLIIAFSFILSATFTANAQHMLVKQWQTDTTLVIPESVLFDAKSKVLYVSLIDGDGTVKDGKGGVAKVGLDGKIIDTLWITGLNAPKGLGKNGNMLYAADIDEVAVIDILKRAVIKKIPVPGAQFLNDIAVDNSKNIVYVSDTKTGKVHKIENGSVTTIAEGLDGANGVLVSGNKLLVLASGALYAIDNNGAKTKLADGMDKSTDGIEEAAPGEYIVSCWSGFIYYAKPGDAPQLMLNTKDENSNTADIGYDKQNKIVYVPTFFKKSVAAYKLQ